MRVSRVYIPQPLTVGALITVGGDRAHYVLNVLRQKKGHSLNLFNGDGYEYTAIIEQVEKKSFVVLVKEQQAKQTESKLHIHLMQGMATGDRFDWVLQKATELGVSEVTPVMSEYAQVKFKAERLGKKMQHWQNILISACEQSGRVSVPTLHPPTCYDDIIQTHQADKKILLHPRSKPGDSLSHDVPTSVTVLIGPEGGFADAEMAQAAKAGWVLQSLGDRVLRTETAPVVMLAILQHLWGDITF